MTDTKVKENQGFEYTYSAKQQKEIEKIRGKYIPKTEDKMETLRKLDRSAEKPGTIISIIIGIIGSLLLGVGMSCTMVWGNAFFALGIVVGVIGIAILSVAYPVYKKITKRQREKIAEQILKLSDEITL